MWGSNPGRGMRLSPKRPDRLCGPPSLIFSTGECSRRDKATGSWGWRLIPASANIHDLSSVTPLLYMPSWRVQLDLLSDHVLFTRDVFWCWKQKLPPKRRHTSIRLHSVIFRKTKILITKMGSGLRESTDSAGSGHYPVAGCREHFNVP